MAAAAAAADVAVGRGCFATLKMESGLVASVTAGNSLSGATTIRLYGTLANAVCADGPVEVTFFVRESPPHADRLPFLRPLPTKRRARRARCPLSGSLSGSHGWRPGRKTRVTG